MKKPQIIVVKLGTSSITNNNGKIDKSKILNIVRQVVAARKLGYRVVVVSSGAVAAGKEILKDVVLDDNLRSKQCYAAVGQSSLMNNWLQLFSIYGVNIGQVLFTRSTMEDRERFLNIRDAMEVLLENDIVPIVNENDAVATSEIKVGDNDNLAMLTAVLVKADKLFLLTDQQGLFTADPRDNPHAKLIKEIAQLDDEMLRMAADTVTGVGTGGMRTKLQAAESAARSGIETIIAASSEPNIIDKLLAGQALGTKILAKQTPLEARKQWIIGAMVCGVIYVDAGAKQALTQQGASLLPKGIVRIGGEFSRGDVVEIKDQQDNLLAVGVTSYNNADLNRIKGAHSAAVNEILGYAYGEVAMHRDNMLLKNR